MRRNELKAVTVRVKKIKRPEIERMYQIFSEYYENHTLQSFEHDLFEKNHVILLKDKKDGSLQGFSTLLRVPLKMGGRKGIGVYSGDTVINKDYWGSAALGIEFLKYLWMLKIRRPGIDVYWFLISKGYKTYLIMANNFKTHYPRYDEEIPEDYKNLMDEFYSKKFGSHYDQSTGLITYEGKACALKGHVADITPELLREPRIAFFQQQNPKWHEGHELTCIAKMTVWMPFKYALKKAFKARKS
ncbi:MAG: hypothetical protein ACLGHN_13510 [Bacteriovoracia bacterium]